ARATTLGHHPGVVLPQLERGGCTGGSDVMDSLLMMENGVGQLTNPGSISFRDSHHVRDDIHGNLACEVTDEAELSRLQRTIEVLARQGQDARLHLAYPAGRERLGDQSAQSGVPRRIGSDERRTLPGVFV